MKDILQNEINRQEYMDHRYKSLDEENNKNDNENGFGNDETTNDESQIKILAEEYITEQSRIYEELGMISKEDEDSSLTE